MIHRIISDAQLAVLGPETNALPAGNFFLNRETAAIFAAASPFANIPVTTENGILSNSQTVCSGYMDIPSKTVSDGFAALSNIQPRSDGSNIAISCDTSKVMGIVS
ncbi:unnamed protein product [Onchocerca flexuosa]|uniref:Bacteriophage protein n=1 Tax=Onchocerca flexuosa TaxID=387005 RepID=A0A183HSQ5_9BILA|nr:unnamed protein product [Onchocerca flexuosa]